LISFLGAFVRTIGPDSGQVSEIHLDTPSSLFLPVHLLPLVLGAAPSTQPVLTIGWKWINGMSDASDAWAAVEK
jgi:hypothetical protein